MSNYAALALVSSASSSSNTNLNSTNNTNIINNSNNNINRSIGGIGNNGISLASGHITPPNSGLNNNNQLVNNNNNNNNIIINSNNQSNTLNITTNNNLTQNFLNQIANINLANSAPSPNRQNNQTINPFFRSNSTIASSSNNNTNQQTQQQQLSNLIQQQQQLQQKKLAGNLMNFANTNSIMNNNNNLINSTISRPQQQNTSQSLNSDPSIPQLDLSDFPALHRQSNSPFQQQQQQQTLHQLQQQLRANNSLNFAQNAPNSAPLLNQSLQSLMLQLQSNSLNNQSSSANNLLMNNLQFSNPNLASLSQSNAANPHGKMWSNFGSSKDRVSLKSQQSTTDNQHQEFNIQQEDFPALPRPQSVHNKNTGSNVDNSGSDSTLKSTSNENSLNSLQLSNTSSTSASNANMQAGNASNKTPNLNSLSTNQNFSNLTNSIAHKNLPSNTTSLSNQSTVKKGIIISPDGRISNVPPNMLLDQFGMVGLLAYLRAADREKDFFALALGTDLTALGLNLNSSENLYHSFLSPFSDVPCRLQDVDFPVPTEYIINCQIKEKLAPIDVTRYTEDTLFYLFYMNGNDLMQLQAASALYDRDWRYHVDKRFWLTKVPGLEPQQKTTAFEKGVYTVFDVNQWRKVQLEMTIEYSKLADKPQLPLQQTQQQQQQAANQQQQQQATSGSILPSVLQQQLHSQQSFTAPTPASLASLNSNPTSASSF